MFYTQGAMQTLADGTRRRRPPVYSCRSCYKVVRKIEPVDELIEKVLLARLAKPDALSVIGAGDQGAVNDALKAMDTLDARLAEAADQFADGAITAEQLSRISTRLREQRDALAREVDLNRPRTAWTDLAGPGVEEKWAGLEIGQKREIIDALMKVTILPVGATRTFDPRSVKIEWKA